MTDLQLMAGIIVAAILVAFGLGVSAAEGKCDE